MVLHHTPAPGQILKDVAAHLAPGGLLGVWSAEPDAHFVAALEQVFVEVSSERIAWTNALMDDETTESVHVGSSTAGVAAVGLEGMMGVAYVLDAVATARVGGEASGSSGEKRRRGSSTIKTR